MPICKKCNHYFKTCFKENGKQIRLTGRRKFCLVCQPFKSRTGNCISDDALFVEAVKKSFSIADVIRYLNYAHSGASYRLIHSRIKRLSLDTSHFDSDAIRKHKLLQYSRHNITPLEDILVEHSSYNRVHLKARLLKEGMIDNICAICGQPPEWQGKPMVLILDHINGVRDDNRRGNLRLLCPNCNIQTETFGTRKRR